MNATAAAIRAQLDEDERVAQAAIADDCGQDGGFEDARDWLTRPPKRVGDAAAVMICRTAVPRRVLAAVRGHRRILDEIEALDQSADADAGPAAAVLLSALAEAVGVE